MRGKRAKELRRAAKELSGSGWQERAPAELSGTRRRKTIKDVLLDGTDSKTGEGKKVRANMEIETFTVINHPTTVRSRYRLLKRAYTEAKHGR